MEWILEAIISPMPAIIGPIINVVILTKPKVKSIFKTPIDFGKNFIDNKRIFGNNKTWKGLFLSIFFCTLASILWGMICKYIPSIGNYNVFYKNYDNTILYNMFIGALLGLVYSLFELPNSFLKRRFNIAPGKSSKKGIMFVILDQFDSVFGFIMVISYFGNLTFLEYLRAVLLNGMLHYIIVRIMCYFKLKESV